MKALIIVDVQVDFCPGGALAAPDGDRVVPVINNIMDKFNMVIASRDWHPQNTVHFEKWLVHCVQNTKGSEFHPGLNISKIRKVFLKGTHDRDDGYSAFEATNENLAGYLKKNKVTELYVSGLATDYCVKETALDSVKNGFKTFVIDDAIKAVNLKPNDENKAKREMQKAGVSIIKSTQLS